MYRSCTCSASCHRCSAYLSQFLTASSALLAPLIGNSTCVKYFGQHSRPHSGLTQVIVRR